MSTVGCVGEANCTIKYNDQVSLIDKLIMEQRIEGGDGVK